MKRNIHKSLFDLVFSVCEEQRQYFVDHSIFDALFFNFI